MKANLMFFRNGSAALATALFSFGALASQEILDDDYFRLAAERMQSLRKNQLSQTSLTTLSQDRFGELVGATSIENSEVTFFDKTDTNLFESEYGVFSASLRNFFMWSNSPPVRLLELQATTNPLLGPNQNIFAAEGAFGGTQANLYGEIGGIFSITMKPVFLLPEENNLRNFYLPESYVSFHARKLSIDIGKVKLRWGYGSYQPMIFGEDFEPFPMIRIRNNEEIEFESPILSWLGKIRYEMFAGQLDGFRDFPDGWIVGSMFSFQPHPRFHFHLTQTVSFGGDGAPTNHPLVFLSEALVDEENASNRNNTFGVRYRIPNLEIEPYLDVYVEDCCGSPPVNPRDMLQLVGLYVPPREAFEKFDFAVEWIRTNYITYRHQSFDYTQSQKVMGHPIGPDGDGIYAIVRYFQSPRLSLENRFAYEIRGKEGRALSASGFVDIRTVDPSFEAAEKRFRVDETVRYWIDPSWKISARLGLERVINANYEASVDRWQALAGLESTYRFR